MKTQDTPTLSFNEILCELKEAELFREQKGPSLDPDKDYPVQAYDDKANDDCCFLLFQAVTRKSPERLQSLLKKGVVFFILEDKSLFDTLPDGCTAFLVHSARSAWTQLSSLFYKRPEASLKLVAVTGTNGKSTTAWILAELLESLGFKAAYLGTLGNSISSDIASPLTTPDPPDLFALLKKAKENNFEYVILEASSHGIEQRKLDRFRFSAALFTSFSRDHLDFHGSLENYLKTKLKLFSKKHLMPGAPVLIGPGVQKYLPHDFVARFKPTFYHHKNEDEQVSSPKTQSYAISEESLNGFTLHASIGAKDLSYTCPYLGRKNQDNFFAALLTAFELTGKLPSKEKLDLKQIPGRLERITGLGNKAPLVFIDFAHSPSALKDTLLTLKKYRKKGKLGLLFGCGGDRDRGKRPLMAREAETHADWLILTSDNPRFENPESILKETLIGIEDKSKLKAVELDRHRALVKALELSGPEDCLLLAGKGHEQYQETRGVREPFSERKIVEKFYKKKLS